MSLWNFFAVSVVVTTLLAGCGSSLPEPAFKTTALANPGDVLPGYSGFQDSATAAKYGGATAWVRAIPSAETVASVTTNTVGEPIALEFKNTIDHAMTSSVSEWTIDGAIEWRTGIDRHFQLEGNLTQSPVTGELYAAGHYVPDNSNGPFGTVLARLSPHALVPQVWRFGSDETGQSPLVFSALGERLTATNHQLGAHFIVASPTGTIRWELSSFSDSPSKYSPMRMFFDYYAFDTHRNVIVAGIALNPFTLGGHTFGEANHAVPVILKFSPDGDFLWGQQVSGLDARVMGVATSALDTVVVSGEFSGTGRWGHDILSQTRPQHSYAGFLLVAEKDGLPRFARQLPQTDGRGSEHGSNLALDPKGQVALALNHSSDITPNATLTPCLDASVIKYNLAGDYLWQRNFLVKGCKAGVGGGVSISNLAFSNGNTLAGGAYQGTVNFGASVLASGPTGEGFLISLLP